MAGGNRGEEATSCHWRQSAALMVVVATFGVPRQSPGVVARLRWPGNALPMLAADKRALFWHLTMCAASGVPPSPRGCAACEGR